MTRTPDRTFQTAARTALLEEIDGARAPLRVRSVSTAPAGRTVFRNAVAIAVAGATVAAGCLGIVALQHRPATVAPPAATQRATARTSTPLTTPSETASVSDDRMRTLIDQVTGTGVLTGPITGRFTITHAYGSPVLHLTDLHVGTSKSRTVLVAVDLASATCRADNVGTTAGTISAASRQTVDLQDSSPQIFSDLSYMKALAIWTQDAGCVADQVSAGTITWTLPEGIRSLAKTDSGSRAGARGDVVVKGGRPVRYTVAPNDRIGSVAARFDLTPWELLYLNPLRDRGSNDQLYDGETLNLSPSDSAYFSRTGF